MTEALQVKNLTVQFDKRVVLWDLSFSIPQGEMVALVGPNGAGKTTVLKTLINMVKPVSGSVTFGDKTIHQMVGRIAYIPQKNSIDWDFPITVLDFVIMGLYNKSKFFRWREQKQVDKAIEALSLLGMEGYVDTPISKLSGGQQQRICFVRALLQDAEFYCLDEPLNGIDKATEAILIKTLNTLRDKGKTILSVHHDLTTIPAYFSRVIIINTRLVAEGSVKEVFTLPNIEEAFASKFEILDEILNESVKQSSGLEE